MILSVPRPAQLPRWILLLILITVPGSTLIVPIAWWIDTRRQAHRNEAMTRKIDNPGFDGRAATLVARASGGWQCNLHDFFAPLIDWIDDARSERHDPQACLRDAYLGSASDLAELERRARNWERCA